MEHIGLMRIPNIEEVERAVAAMISDMVTRREAAANVRGQLFHGAGERIQQVGCEGFFCVHGETQFDGLNLGKIGRQERWSACRALNTATFLLLERDRSAVARPLCWCLCNSSRRAGRECLWPAG